MKIKVVSNENRYFPKLGEVLPGILVLHQNHVYIKINKCKVGEGISIQWPTDCSLLLNQKYASIRAVSCEQRVTVLSQVKESRVVEMKNEASVLPYLRQKQYR